MDLEQGSADGAVGLEIKLRFYTRQLYSQGLRCYGASVGLTEFLSHFKGFVERHAIKGRFFCKAFVNASTMDEGAMIFSNGRVLRFLAADTNDGFRLYSIDSEFFAGWEAEGAADLGSIRSNMEPIENLDTSESLTKLHFAMRNLELT